MTAIDFVRAFFKEAEAPISVGMLVLVANTRYGLPPLETRNAVYQLEKEGVIGLNERSRLYRK